MPDDASYAQPTLHDQPDNKGRSLVLAACVFLVGRVWASLKATWKG